MMRAVMEGSGLSFWPVFSLIVFTLYAAGLVAWLYRSGSRGFYRDMAGLALGGENAGPGALGDEAGTKEGREHGRQG